MYCSKPCSDKQNLIKANNNKRIHSDVKIACETCGVSFTVEWKHRVRRFCCKSCVNKFPPRVERFLKAIEGCAQDPKRNEKISRALKVNNPSKRPTARAKISATLKAKPKKPKPGKITPRYYTKTHKDVRCRWYHYTDRNNVIHYCQGSYELAFAAWLDQQEIDFVSHPSHITYINENGKTSRYHPDFYLKHYCVFVDVKSSYTLKKDIQKLAAIRASNLNFRLLVVSEPEMNEVGVDLCYKTLLKLRAKYEIQLA